MGFEQPTPIQEKAIPIILSGSDLIACAQTGTGKTAAFILPVLNNIVKNPGAGVNTMILAPTRELAMQIDQQIEGFSYFTNSSSIAIYGGGDGQDYMQQKRALKRGADIIIATPGRLISLLGSKEINLSGVKHLILDEADRMLDMGFFDDIMKIISHLPRNRQTLLFSATMPSNIRKLAGSIMKDYEEVSISISKPAEGILQKAYMTFDNQKEPLLIEVLKNVDYQTVIVFASTKEKVKNLTRSLQKNKVKVKDFHSDLDQSQREKIMQEFKARNLRVLIGTDILSRGIDVEGIDLVVNFDVPPDPEDYVHRIGRTARASKTGTAITFINQKDVPRFRQIEKLIERELEKENPPDFIGKGPEYQQSRKRDYERGGNRNSGNSPKRKSNSEGKRRKPSRRKNSGQRDS
ncbi:MAG: DEAD/DEAH box helicase [Saprospirales bacterium]|nr:MAG: DEAD/DEAH box helicase [Saprospirales bacterium]